jgi:xanthine dehydrogenase iron-sulfur cluster and FAD-binding subunit A
MAKWKDGELVPVSLRAVITSNGCACEDYERLIDAGRTQAAAKLTLQVAPLRDTRGRSPQNLADIAAGRHLDYFLVYGERNVLPDQIVDFSREQPVPASVLSGCTKIARLADWQWNGLLVHLAVTRFHQTAEELFRPELLKRREGGPDAA